MPPKNFGSSRESSFVKRTTLSLFSFHIDVPTSLGISTFPGRLELACAVIEPVYTTRRRFGLLKNFTAPAWSGLVPRESLSSQGMSRALVSRTGFDQP